MILTPDEEGFSRCSERHEGRQVDSAAVWQILMFAELVFFLYFSAQVHLIIASGLLCCLLYNLSLIGIRGDSVD